MAQFKSKHAVLLTLRSVSMQCNAMQCNTINAMQCNTMQCNAMQCNAMQCNVCTEVRPSVRNEVSQSFFFFFFFCQYVRSPSVCTEHECHGRTEVFSYFFLVSMYECHGWTDKFQLFQFSFSSVAYSQVSLSVRTVPTKKRKKNMLRTKTKHRSDRVVHNGKKN
jgi:hypothetical protein